jgi:pyruvate/2-oxoglutarate/acetoin dehydrogenase E1 component
MKPKTVLDSLNSGLRQALAADRRVILLGEDLLDPYGGAFKVTRGLSTDYPAQVWSTPISEAGIVGLASGMALRGLLPVVEIMFGDFLTLAADQLINHAAKFRWMYNEQVRVPLVVRTPMGGQRGYGPTHSQTVEKHFLGVPGLRVLAPTAICNGEGDQPGELLLQAILRDDNPVLFVEHKLLYMAPLQKSSDLVEWDVTGWDGYPRDISYPSYLLKVKNSPPAVLTLATYGYMAEAARRSVLRLAYEYEVFCELVILTQLSPFALEPVLDSTSRTRRLLTVEEGTFSMGWGAEVLSQASERLRARLLAAGRLAGRDLPIPASRALETAVLPGEDQVVESCLRIAGNG